MHLKVLFLIPLMFFLSRAGTAGMDNMDQRNMRGLQVRNICRHTVESSLKAARPSPLLKAFRIKQKKDKKVVAALLAFPFPFGIVGLHRIYLGCAPYVPVAYIASLGGVFGALPLTDFIALIFTKDLDKYINSKKIFMWIN